ncbi:hypothetical protein PR003_g20041 [Phytophthora rubi]|uniref:Uncharacterized protein n=1 Tax=Phytophthora rubi TaxID=129364 RepID=A0A6A4E2D5_9STRA|nr:hypothetical protein PR002_g19273 [Phytophthora rubi]KAE9000003.1 hypothetical protein PR001_g18907 [Phytophthora rubi]KAE9311353.1 hypothetical protein PR003_g20041 [Phytophthora rubi]
MRDILCCACTCFADRARGLLVGIESRQLIRVVTGCVPLRLCISRRCFQGCELRVAVEFIAQPAPTAIRCGTYPLVCLAKTRALTIPSC